ncbi:hypothetical protein PHMEG_00018037 [Phytophthora megakarya]|uniref:Uncharacterized protein n=1 Tax=Phytophthora megakarya TaxID=4795 RepID=A0A225VV15_9STRA|nr:hypothetical protein PHMEG_00018037 [Phytophthora megakarya]
MRKSTEHIITPMITLCDGHLCNQIDMEAHAASDVIIIWPGNISYPISETGPNPIRWRSQCITDQ